MLFTILPSSLAAGKVIFKTAMAQRNKNFKKARILIKISLHNMQFLGKNLVKRKFIF